MEDIINKDNQTNNDYSINIDFDLPDIEEDFHFKPITRGLGFHNDLERQYSKKPKIKPKKSDISLTNPKESSNLNKNTCINIFQEKKVEVKKAKNIRKKVDFIKATRQMQAIAWAIDVLVIILAMMITMLLFALAPGLSVKAILDIVSVKDLIMFSIFLFFCYYVTYFTLMDLFVSPGKYLLNIKLVSTTKEPLRYYHTLFRAIASLSSFLALGLPLIMDFQGKLSDTKVIIKDV